MGLSIGTARFHSNAGPTAERSTCIGRPLPVQVFEVDVVTAQRRRHLEITCPT
jgi:hypothetical protein